MHEVIMPKLGLTMESGVIEKWHKKEGDRVQEGDVLFEVMTDKVSLEVEAYNSGYLRKIVKGEDQEVPVTEVVAYIGEKEEPLEEQAPSADKPKIEVTNHAIDERSSDSRQAVSPVARKLAEQKNIDLSNIKGSGPRGRIVKQDIESYKEDQKGRIKISPLARKLAAEKGIDYKDIKGSGPGGRIVKKDILSAAGSESEARVSNGISVKSTETIKGIRKTIAQRMSQSYSSIPHVYFTAKAEADNLVSLRERLKEKAESLYGAKITYTDFMVKIAASVLKELPRVNSSLQGEKYIIYQDINIGMATSIQEGLIVPTIYNADQLSILEIAKRRIELIDKSKQGKLSPEEVSNGTFTVSNLGMYKSVREFTAIINPPQAAILAVGAIYTEPSLVEGRIEPKSFVNVTLAVDHRILDGAVAAEFLDKVVELIQNPELLVI